MNIKIISWIKIFDLITNNRKKNQNKIEKINLMTFIFYL